MSGRLDLLKTEICRARVKSRLKSEREHSTWRLAIQPSHLDRIDKRRGHLCADRSRVFHRMGSFGFFPVKFEAMSTMRVTPY